jgi:DNA gyrase subunit A
LSEEKFKYEEHDPSGALKFLVENYAAYAAEVVLERALPGIDGFKPGQRRKLFRMLDKKLTSNTKSATVVGDTLPIHPHGDGAIYAALARMVDSAEIMNVPFIDGKGFFGKVYSENPPAASRYTECRLSSIAKELWQEVGGVEFTLAEDNATMEPTLLPTSFPNVLCNATAGIAVGLASNIPSFNFHEVNNMVIEYLTTGKFTKTLTPDFPTGELYVRNDVELNKLMTTGKASMKLRGRWRVEGKTIIITCIPFYTTVQLMMRQIAALESKMVSDVRDESDRHGLKLAVECSSKDAVQYVLADLLKNTDLQKTTSSNITVIINNEPRVIGVAELIQEWVKFRAGVLTKQFNLDLSKVSEVIARDEARNNLIMKMLEEDNTLHDYLNHMKANKGATSEAKNFVRKTCGDVDESAVEWFVNLPNHALYKIQDRVTSLEGLYAKRGEINHNIEYVYDFIAAQLSEINKSYSYPRKVEVTDEDFVFAKEDRVVKPDPVAVEVFIEDKFVKKVVHVRGMASSVDAINCMSDDIISFIDDKGRLLRVFLDQLPFGSQREAGTYLPSYLGVEDDFEVISYNLVEDKTIGYLFDDGFVSVVDYSEWTNMQKSTKITMRGISGEAKRIVHEVNLNKQYILVYTNKGRVGVYDVGDFKQKHRTARTRLTGFKQNDTIIAAASLDMVEVMTNLSNFMGYLNTLTKLKKGDTLNSDVFA